jgi:amino acid transporter
MIHARFFRLKISPGSLVADQNRTSHRQCFKYGMAEILPLCWQNKKMGFFKQGFYFVMVISILVAICINFTGISPVRALVITAIIYGLTAPLLIFVILLVSNNKKIMGDYTNKAWSNIFGIAALLLMVAAGIMLLFV